MIAKYIVLSNIISVILDSTFCICIQAPLLILKKIVVLLHTLSAYNACSSAITFTRLVPGNACAHKAEVMVNPMKTLVLIQHHVKRIL